MSDGPPSSQEWRTSGWHISWGMANNSASTYHSHSIRILSVCPFLHTVQFFPCGWVPNTFENMVALNTAVDLKSLHSQFRRASVRHALKALRLRHKYSSKSPNLNFANIKIQPFFRHFAKFNARQIFPLYGTLIPTQNAICIECEICARMHKRVPAYPYGACVPRVNKSGCMFIENQPVSSAGVSAATKRCT